MNVKWKDGVVSYAMTKPEMKTLTDAVALIEQVSNVKGPIGEKAEAGAAALKEMLDMLGAQLRAPERAQEQSLFSGMEPGQPIKQTLPSE